MELRAKAKRSRRRSAAFTPCYMKRRAFATSRANTRCMSLMIWHEIVIEIINIVLSMKTHEVIYLINILHTMGKWMMKFTKLIIVTFIIIISCSEKYNVIYSVDRNGKATFIVNNSCCWFPNTTIRIKDIAVYDHNRKLVLWRLYTTLDNGGKYLNKIVYGEVPEGFSEMMPSKTLLKGNKYIIMVRCSGGGGEIEFIY